MGPECALPILSSLDPIPKGTAQHPQSVFQILLASLPFCGRLHLRMAQGLLLLSHCDG
jgi:hypothetical protein